MMKKNKRLLIVMASALAAVQVAAYFVYQDQAFAFPGLGKGRVITVYSGEGGFASKALLARVSVGVDGAIGLEPKRESEEVMRLRRALAEAKGMRELNLKMEQIATVDGETGRAASAITVGPDDPRYVWAVLDHLRRRGLRCALKAETGAAK